MKGDVIIRRASEKDLAEIIRIWKRNIKTINTPADISHIFFLYQKYFLVAEIDGKGIVGFVGGSVRGWDGKKRGHISGIAVDREYRGMGIGSKLIKAVEEYFRRDAFDRVTLEVRISNRTAIDFYEWHGYRKIYVVRGYYADGEDAFIYEKKLLKENEA